MSEAPSDRPPPGIGRERQFEVYVGGARGAYPRVPVSYERLERERAEGDVAGGVRVRRGRGRSGGDDPREPCCLRALADRPAHAARRLTAGDGRGGPRHALLLPVRPLPHRRPRDGASRRGRRGRSRGRGGGDPDDLLQPGLAADGGDRPRDGRRAALVPALLEHARRARREPRVAGRGVRVQRDRAHARHDDARLARPRPRSRVPPVPARQGDRAVHERPGVHGGAAGDAARGAARPAGSPWPRSARSGSSPARSRGRGWRACAPAWRARPSSASSRPTRGPRSRGTTSRSSASARGSRSC